MLLGPPCRKIQPPIQAPKNREVVAHKPTLSRSIFSSNLEDTQLLNSLVQGVSPQLALSKDWLIGLCATADELSVMEHGGTLVARSRRAYGESLQSLRGAVARPCRADQYAIQKRYSAILRVWL